MTAEVAIVNPFAVALAADSAVTINTSNGETKIFNSVEKLFRLSETQPIALMVYGNGNFADISWELLAKQFRYENSGQKFDKIETCVFEFLKFLKNRTDIVPLESRASYTYSKLDLLIKNIFIVAVDRLSGSDVNDETVKSEVIAELNRHKSTLQDMDYRFELSKAEEDIISKEIAEHIKGTASEVYSAFIDDDLIKLINETATMYLTRAHDASNHSGLVFAGFGTLEFKPTVESYNFFGAISEYIFAQRNLHLCHDPKSSVSVIPFAQGDVIHSFIKGMAPSVHASIESQSRAFAAKTIEKFFTILDESNIENADEIKEDLKQYIKIQRRSFLDNITDSANEKLVEPITRMLEFLPKDELATMAESLVNMTAFRRKVSHDNETVGGPVDVAVLSKNDGFVWIKRKHYFPREMNDHFFKNRN